jgi:Family of unknown function (DUF6518)
VLVDQRCVGASALAGGILLGSVDFVWIGVLAGVVFGVAGVWARATGWRRVAGIALPGAVLLAEAVTRARRIGHSYYGNDPWLAVIHAVLGVLVIVLVARTGRQRAAALAVAPPLALLGYAVFLVAGIR